MLDEHLRGRQDLRAMLADSGKKKSGAGTVRSKDK
jgi:hypothetical protein